MKGSVGYGSSDAHVVSDEIMFLFGAGLQHPRLENQGSCTRVYISTSQSLDNNPTRIADPWALPKRNLTFTEHMAGQIKNYLQAHTLASITYIRSARLAKSI